MFMIRLVGILKTAQNFGGRRKINKMLVSSNEPSNKI